MEAHSCGWQVGAGWWPRASGPLHTTLLLQRVALRSSWLDTCLPNCNNPRKQDENTKTFNDVVWKSKLVLLKVEAVTAVRPCSRKENLFPYLDRSFSVLHCRKNTMATQYMSLPCSKHIVNTYVQLCNEISLSFY